MSILLSYHVLDVSCMREFDVTVDQQFDFFTARWFATSQVNSFSLPVGSH